VAWTIIHQRQSYVTCLNARKAEVEVSVVRDKAVVGRRNGVGCERRGDLAMLQAWRWMSAVLLRVFEPEVRAWYGLEPLWKVFWGYGVLASAVIIALYAVATIERRAAMQQLLLMFFAGYTIWILVSVWRCAATSMPIWQTLARSSTVAWAVNAVLVIFFLELDLMADWLRLS
jgi:hypothetical protein